MKIGMWWKFFENHIKGVSNNHPEMKNFEHSGKSLLIHVVDNFIHSCELEMEIGPKIPSPPISKLQLQFLQILALI